MCLLHGRRQACVRTPRPLSIVTKRSPTSATAEHLFLFVYEISREQLNGFVPNSHGRRVWSLSRTNLKINVKGQRSRSPGIKKRHFRPFRRPAYGLCLVKHLCPLVGRPFVKRFALCYRSVDCPVLFVCLSVMSVTFVHCGQTVGRIKMKLGMQVGLGPGHIVLDGTQLLSSPSPKGTQPPIFGPYPLQPRAAWIKMSLGMELGLSPGDFVLDGDPATSPQLFGPCLLWPNGRPSQQRLSSLFYRYLS